MTDRPRRVLMVVHGPYPQDVRVAREARTLAAAGWEVDVIATSAAGEQSREEVDGVVVHRLPVEHRRGGGAVAMASEYLRFTALAAWRAARLQRRRRYRVVHIHNPPDFLVLAALVSRLRGARVVLDVHDLAPDMFAMRFEGRRGARLADRVLRVVERFAIAVADLVVTVHEPYRRELVHRGASFEATVVVMNSIDERLLPPPTTAGAGFRAVYHGTVTPHYGVDLLVEAAARLRDSIPGFEAEIFGDGDAVADLRRLVDRLELTDVVLVDGRALPHGEVLRRVAGAAAGVIPNLDTRLNQYALSTKLFEYVALRIPVACAALPTLREHFSDEEVLFFRAGDADDLAAALREIHGAPAAAAQRAERAALRARAYSWQVNAARLVQAFDQLAGRQTA
jgi:glycosyltransferase involved in cell wall biosynthesis